MAIYIINVGGKPCGKEVTNRRETLSLHLKEGFELKEGAKIKFSTVSTYLALDKDRKTLATCVVKETFPGVYIRRDIKMGQKQYPFTEQINRYNIHEFCHCNYNIYQSF